MRDGKDKIMLAHGGGKSSHLEGSNEKSDGANVSTDISPDKQPSGSSAAGAVNDDNISPEGLLEVISQEWKNEMERIKANGLNGYKRRKESRNECLVQSGHAEIEGDSMLFIYGNALEVLSNTEF